ncbi:835_t:CDS:2, partial [Paraglomus brasilianum]
HLDHKYNPLSLLFEVCSVEVVQRVRIKETRSLFLKSPAIFLKDVRENSIRFTQCSKFPGPSSIFRRYISSDTKLSSGYESSSNEPGVASSSESENGIRKFPHWGQSVERIYLIRYRQMGDDYLNYRITQ